MVQVRRSCLVSWPGLYSVGGQNKAAVTVATLVLVVVVSCKSVVQLVLEMSNFVIIKQ